MENAETPRIISHHHITMHRIASHRIASHRIASHRIALLHIMSCPYSTLQHIYNIFHCTAHHFISRYITSYTILISLYITWQHITSSKVISHDLCFCFAFCFVCFLVCFARLSDPLHVPIHCRFHSVLIPIRCRNLTILWLSNSSLTLVVSIHSSFSYSKGMKQAVSLILKLLIISITTWLADKRNPRWE